MNEETENIENSEETGNIENQNEQINIDKLKVTKLQGLFNDWFLDYASYVLLDRSIPHLSDGLKPVQRRILHSMREKEDGRYNKVANLVGHTMQYHPHGDASIGDALVVMGQKELLIDTQGNWGNILTGDPAAAPRYIEARLTKFALEVVFNPKTTTWKPSYDGRNKEPEQLPVKFPLLLAMGQKGIGVSLRTEILPHNFIEILDACVAYLEGKKFQLLPDFPTGGLVDCTNYNDGKRGGKVLIRAKIEKTDKKTVTIRELPFGKTSEKLIASITAASDKNKINIKKIDDNTAQNVEIVIHLMPGDSPDEVIDALYKFTDCQYSITNNICVVKNDKPQMMSVSEILKCSVDDTVNLLKRELEIEKQELEDQWQNLSLEKWFIEKRIYKEKQYEEAKSTDDALDFIYARVLADKLKLIREVTRDDILKLLEIKMKRILRFNADKAEEELINIEEQIKKCIFNLEHLIDYAISWYKHLKDKYQQGKERKTEIRIFDSIDATKVVVANEKLYVNYATGYIGYKLDKDNNNIYICDCSDIDDVIVFFKDGKYKVIKAPQKLYLGLSNEEINALEKRKKAGVIIERGENIQYVNVFYRNDTRTIYNVVYRDGKTVVSYMKRFYVSGVTRDKEYDLTQGKIGSKLLYFSANPNGEAETIKVVLKPKPKIRKNVFPIDFKELSIKGREANGNILSKNEVHKIELKESGISTLGGRKIWFDSTVLRLNADNRGDLLGEFEGDDKILVFYKDGMMQLTNFDISNHYEDNILIIEKFKPRKIFSVIYFDSEQKFMYVKRFQIDVTTKPQYIIPETEGSFLVEISDDNFPTIKIIFDGKSRNKEPEIVDVEQFIGIKSISAKGKRLTTFQHKTIEFDIPLQKEMPEIELEIIRPTNENNNDFDDYMINPDNVIEQSLF